MATVPNRAIFFTAWTDTTTAEYFPLNTNALITDQAQLNRIDAASVAWLDPTFDPASPVPIGESESSTGRFTLLRATLFQAISQGSAAEPVYSRIGDLNTGVYFPGDDQIGITTAGALRLVVDQLGRHGIGTPTPAAGVHINVATAATEALRISNSADAARIHIRPGSIEAHNASLELTAMDAFPLSLKTLNIQRALITSAGSTVFGAGTPDYFFHIKGGGFGFAGQASLDPANNGDVVFEATSNTSITVKHRGSDGTIRSTSLTLA